ncbi:MAG: T9SS type A sorting domain-containing protein [Ignavibacteria bacterium]|jgi:hypothetical protein|nr:T9SS type A sorting domain-containing protein [Ignavibacteria bacterium]
MKKLLIILLFSVSAFVFDTYFIYADEPTQYESEGTDFWFTFMPNFHQNNPYYRDSLYIFVTSKYPTKGVIYYYEISPTSITPKTINFEITQPNQIYKKSLWYYRVALQGYNQMAAGHSNFSLTNSDCEVASKKVIHIVTDEKSTVYAFDYAEKSADAFIVLPTPALGLEYYALSYPSNAYPNYQFAPDSLGINSTPSQFAIVAVNDGTTVRVTPSCPTRRYGIVEKTITLNKGEAYLVQADMDLKSNRNGDLSGSHIIADKEIAVFGGHQRTEIPIENAIYPYGSRDCLIEQIIPVHAWGKNAILTPFARSTYYNEYNDLDDEFRVLACKDSTIVMINRIPVDTLQKGKFYAGKLKAGIVSSNNPILVAQYIRTEQPTSTSSAAYGYGDPSMIIVPPIEQYKTDYNVVNPQILINGSNHLVDQFLTIIAPDEDIGEVYVDGKLLDASKFIPIPNSGCSYIELKSTWGGHNISCKDPISVQIYGYGSAVSYAYLGGMSFRDLEHGRITLNVDSCYRQATFAYNQTYNSGIVSYEILESVNCIITEDTITNLKLRLNITKKEYPLLAYFTVQIIDLYGDTTVLSDTIHTLAFDFSNVNEENIIDFGQCNIAKQHTALLNIVNTGDVPLNITNDNFLLSQNILFTIPKSQFPIKIPVADSAYIKIAYTPHAKHKKAIFDTDTLFVSNSCYNYTLILNAEPTADTLDFTGLCNTPIRAIADSTNGGWFSPIVTPNPVSENVVYKFNINENSLVAIKLYSEIGTLIGTLHNGYLQSGNYEIGISTDKLPLGVYFINLETSENKIATKLLINRN